MASQRAGIGGDAGEFLYSDYTIGFIGLSRAGEMAVGVLEAEILSLGIGQETLQCQEIIGTREPGPEQVIVTIGRI